MRAGIIEKGAEINAILGQKIATLGWWMRENRLDSKHGRVFHSMSCFPEFKKEERK